jgi:DNA-binding MarR family transcriptional regulator
MADSRTSNVVGALVLALSDDLMRAAQSKAPEIGPAAAALALLGHVPGMPIERLRRALGLSHPGAVRLVDRLERDGAAVRRQSQDDRRAVALSLTAKGGRVVGEILSAREASLAKALSGLSSAEQRPSANSPRRCCGRCWRTKITPIPYVGFAMPQRAGIVRLRTSLKPARRDKRLSVSAGTAKLRLRHAVAGAPNDAAARTEWKEWRARRDSNS